MMFFLSYEYCNGGNLKRYLRYLKKFSEKLIQNIMKQIIQGLYYIFHHALKPENILVDLRQKDGSPLPKEKIQLNISFFSSLYKEKYI